MRSNPYNRKQTRNFLPQNLYDFNQDGEMPAPLHRIYHIDGTSITVEHHEVDLAVASGNYYRTPWEAKARKANKKG